MNIQGLIKATVLPPFQLYHPVLPFCYQQKLYFPLCRQCVIDQCSKCQHDAKQRSITGTWVSLELQKAVQVGYVIVKLQEAWHFNKVSKFDQDRNVFLTLKQQASGYPADCIDEEAYTAFHSAMECANVVVIIGQMCLSVSDLYWSD
uniref:Uncharacterized protein n=1 Tax=Strigamia maritima TaxID=126957 RepID=T1ITE0_STRMM